jgi:hypothetical protein
LNSNRRIFFPKSFFPRFKIPKIVFTQNWFFRNASAEAAEPAADESRQKRQAEQRLKGMNAWAPQNL